MHPLLHTQENKGCEELMFALEECHARGFLFKMIGGCNEAKSKLNKCLREARLERTRLNFEKSKEKNEKIRAMWKEVDENS